MIYATMCVGSEWIDRFKKSINEFSNPMSYIYLLMINQTSMIISLYIDTHEMYLVTTKK